MQLGEIKERAVIDEYVARLENAIAVATELKQEPRHSRHSANLSLVIYRLERIIAEAKQGRIVNDIAGMTKFAGDWPIDHARLALAIWEAERYFNEKILREVMTQLGRA